MLLENLTEWESLYHIFDLIDEMVKNMEKETKNKFIGTLKSKGGRPSGLSLQSLLSLGLFRLVVGIKDIKHYHNFLLTHYSGELGRIPNYPNFNRLMNKSLSWMIILIQALLSHKRKKSMGDLYFIDSTPLKVCTNKRIFDHKVCDGFAKRGKSSLGFFFGFKLHMVCDSRGELISMMITPGNVDDRKPVPDLLKDLKGLVVGDAGYLSKKLMLELFEQGILFLTGVKKNMKRLMTPAQHKLLKMRQTAEGVFSILKYRLNMEASNARSMTGYMSRVVFPCLLFILQPKLKIIGQKLLS